MWNENKKSVLFIIKLLLGFICAYILHNYLLIPHSSIDSVIISSLLSITEYILSNLDYSTFSVESEQIVGIVGTTGVNIGHACDGLSLFLLFGTFIALFPGKPWFKTLYLISGCLAIHLINSIRIAALAYIHYSSPEFLSFHHTYTFTMLVYLLIFFAWALRIKIYSLKKL